MHFRALAASILGLTVALGACSSGNDHEQSHHDTPSTPGATKGDAGATPSHGGLASDAGAGAGEDAGTPEAGPAPTAGYCSGLAACTGSALECAAIPGCRYESDACEGIAKSCYSLYSSYSCTAQDGCYWSYSTNSCSGVARSCSIISKYSCTRQDGCRSAAPSCTGYPLEGCYSQETPSECKATAGCTWQSL